MLSTVSTHTDASGKVEIIRRWLRVHLRCLRGLALLGMWRVQLWNSRRRKARALARGQRSVRSFPAIQSKRRHGLPGELIVNLTSYRARFAVLGDTLRGLLDQTVQQDRTILWVDRDAIGDLPNNVTDLQQYGLEIMPCVDVRSYTKLVHAISAFPDAYLVTADDDLYYPPNWLSHLLDGYRSNPGCIISLRAHLADIGEDGSLGPYAKWDMDTVETTDVSPDKILFPTGVGGILYPPRSLDPMVTNAESFLKIAPKADDLWFFWMAELQGTKHVRASSRFEIITWPSSQEVGLLHSNLFGGENDIQIEALQQNLGRLAPPINLLQM